MNNLKQKKINGQAGQAMMVAVILFMVVSMTMILGIAGPVLRQRAIVSSLALSRQSYFLAEAGIEDAVYRLKMGKAISPVETMSLNGNTSTVAISDTADGKQIVSIADYDDRIRKVKTDVVLGSGTSFYFGIQAGTGGLTMENTSSVSGNVFSNGVVRGSGPTNNIIRGSVVSGGAGGLVDNVYATSSVYANTIRNAKIDGDAYYQSISNTTVLGALHPGSTDQAVVSLPISDEQIEEWKQAALSGGVISSPCPYQITDAVTLGPVKINCDLEIKGTGYTVTLGGNVWVEGNIEIENSPTIKVASSLGNKGVVVIADKPSSPSASGKISLENSVMFNGSGVPGSYVMFISQNESAESGGELVAINVKNTVSGALLVYAAHGEILLQNSIDLKEVSAYKIRLKNTAKVVYESGMANLLFDSGPSGGYEILSWKEIE